MLDNLITRCPPPSAPIGRDRNSTEYLNGRLPFGLPDDYLLFCNRYGSGRFRGRVLNSLMVLNPFESNYPALLDRWMADLRAYVRRMDEIGESENWNESVPLTLYPTDGGLLFWGYVEHAFLCWITEGTPTEWPIAVLGATTIRERHHLCVTEFLWELLSCRLESQRWNDLRAGDFDDVVFQPKRSE